jgi:hypothetical protein
MTSPDNTGTRHANGRFRKGFSGNPAGAPHGSRNRATILAERLLQSDIEDVCNAVVATAKNGDMTAAKIIIERLVPPRKDRPISFALPEISNGQHLSQAAIGLLRAVADGGVTPEEAGQVMRLIEGAGKAIEIGELEARIAALEARSPK